jgi:hypothetical protein
MKRVSAPVSTRQQRNLDLAPVRGSTFVIAVDQLMSRYLGAELAPVFIEFRLRHRFRAAHQIPVYAADRSVGAEAMLYRLHLHVVPIRLKRAENSALVVLVAIPVSCAFPNADRRKMRRL